jgi:hypothetical protein
VSRKPLSIALEEIEVGKIVKADPIPEAEADSEATAEAGAEAPADDAG